MAMLYSPSQIFQTQFAYTARFCRNSSRNQLTAKGARRVDGQNSSAVTSKKNSDSMAKFACSPLAKMPAGSLPLKPYCMCLSFSVVFCPENAKPNLPLDPSQLLICVSPRQNRLRYVQQSDCGVVMTALSQNTPEISWPQTKYLLRRRGDHQMYHQTYPKFVELPDRLTHRILLTARSVLATLIIKDSHRQVLQAGTTHTLALTRLQYWILTEERLLGE